MNKFQQEIADRITDPNALMLIQQLQNELKHKDGEIDHLKDLLDNEKREAERQAYKDKWYVENFEKYMQQRRELEAIADAEIAAEDEEFLAE
jgi:hypothetical protein